MLLFVCARNIYWNVFIRGVFVDFFYGFLFSIVGCFWCFGFYEVIRLGVYYLDICLDMLIICEFSVFAHFFELEIGF